MGVHGSKRVENIAAPSSTPEARRTPSPKQLNLSQNSSPQGPAMKRVLKFDPRSPSSEIPRTPIYIEKTPIENAFIDPRSPTVDFQRTPITVLPGDECDTGENTPKQVMKQSSGPTALVYSRLAYEDYLNSSREQGALSEESTQQGPQTSPSASAASSSTRTTECTQGSASPTTEHRMHVVSTNNSLAVCFDEKSLLLRNTSSLSLEDEGPCGSISLLDDEEETANDINCGESFNKPRPNCEIALVHRTLSEPASLHALAYWERAQQCPPDVPTNTPAETSFAQNDPQVLARSQGTPIFQTSPMPRSPLTPLPGEVAVSPRTAVLRKQHAERVRKSRIGLPSTPKQLTLLLPQQKTVLVSNNTGAGGDKTDNAKTAGLTSSEACSDKENLLASC